MSKENTLKERFERRWLLWADSPPKHKEDMFLFLEHEIEQAQQSKVDEIKKKIKRELEKEVIKGYRFAKDPLKYKNLSVANLIKIKALTDLLKEI